MRLLEDHLDPQELAGLRDLPDSLGAPDFGTPEHQEVLAHLRQCADCATLAHLYRRLRTQAQAGEAVGPGDCPSEAIWLDLAGGLLTRERPALLAHAATCDRCATRLKEAMELMRPEEDEAMFAPVPSLASATPEWQRRMAAKLAAAAKPDAAKPTLTVLPARRIPRRVAYPIAAVLVAGVALGSSVAWRIVHPSDAKLLAMAYNKQRTLPLRIPGGEPVPLATGTRAAGDGLVDGLSDPTELTELKLRAQKHLDQTPTSPYWHLVLGEVELQKLDGYAARRNFEIVQTSDENLPNLQADLAAAWFEIGLKTGNAEAYAEAAELYSRQINTKPAAANSSYSAMLYYNRALCWEHQSLTENALDDLRAALRVEPSSAWRKAIQAEIDRISSHSSVAPGDGYEGALDEATTQLLPHWSSAAEARTRLTLVAALGMKHHDRWLTDWIGEPHTLQTDEADRHLAGAVAAGNAGEPEASLNEARQAVELYRRADAQPGLIRSELAIAYALQRLVRSHECVGIAKQIKQEPRVNSYGWIHTQLLLEEGNCRGLIGGFDEAQQAFDESLAQSDADALPSLHLRALGLKGWFLSARGFNSAAWQINTASLDFCARISCSPVRHYQAVYNLVGSAGKLGMNYVATELMRTAARIAGSSSDETMHAYALERLATLEGRVGNFKASDEAFDQATTLARAGHQAPMGALYQAEWEMDRAGVLSRKGDYRTALQVLQQSGQPLEQSDYRPGRLLYFTELSEVQRSLGHEDAALRDAWMAVHQSEDTLHQLQSVSEREAWARENLRQYSDLVANYLQHGQPVEALMSWERYRSAAFAATPEASETLLTTATGRSSSTPKVLVLAHIGPDYIGWLVNVEPFRLLHTANLGDAAHILRDATTFYRLCSDRTSSISDVQAVGSKLYRTLFQPFSAELGEISQLDLDVDPGLAILPFSALVTPGGAWLGKSVQIDLLPAWWALHADTLNHLAEVSPKLRLVAVSGFGEIDPVAAEGSEVAEVASLFAHPLVLAGHSATQQTVLAGLSNAELFHFSGHATSETNSAVLISGTGSGRTALLDATKLSTVHLQQCRLAVLAACNTTTTDPDQLEQMTDLRDAFLLGGAATVIASSWDVDDQSTRSLMTAFYRDLVSSGSPAHSLQLARQAVAKDSHWAHPFFWSSFQLYRN